MTERPGQLEVPTSGPPTCPQHAHAHSGHVEQPIVTFDPALLVTRTCTEPDTPFEERLRLRCFGIPPSEGEAE